MTPDPLKIDFLRQRQAPGWPSYLLLAAALAFGASLVFDYYGLQREVRQMESRLAAGPRTAPAAPVRAPDAAELEHLREVAQALATPWERLFGALQAAHGEKITLLAIEPDAQAGTVAISAEAQDYLAALSYVATLAQQPALHHVRLLRHETQRGNARRPIAFTVAATWKSAP